MAKKTNSDYLNELEEIRDKLSDYTDFMRQGKINYYKDIALKLRVLYCYKSGTPSLLNKIFELYNFKFYVFILLSLKEMGHDIFFTLSFTYSVTIWLDSGKEERFIIDALNRNEIMIKNRTFTYKEIIEVVADKMVAHIDEKIDDGHLGLHSQQILLHGLPIAQQVIYDIAVTSIEVINIISKYIRFGKESRFIRVTEADKN